MIPFGNNFNIKNKIGNQWEKEFTLLGIEIDNRLEKLDCNFDGVHSKTLSLIHDWRARRLPINISKCPLVRVLAAILTLSEQQIGKAWTAVNNYIMDKK